MFLCLQGLADSFDDEFLDDGFHDINLHGAEMSMSHQCLLAEKQVKATQMSIAAATGNDTEHYQKKLIRLERALAEKNEELQQYQEIKEGAVLYRRLPTDLSEPEQQPILLKCGNLESRFLAANLPCWAPWRLLRGLDGFTAAGIAKALNKTASRPFVWGRVFWLCRVCKVDMRIFDRPELENERRTFNFEESPIHVDDREYSCSEDFLQNSKPTPFDVETWEQSEMR